MTGKGEIFANDGFGMVTPNRPSPWLAIRAKRYRPQENAPCATVAESKGRRALLHDGGMRYAEPELHSMIDFGR